MEKMSYRLRAAIKKIVNTPHGNDFRSAVCLRNRVRGGEGNMISHKGAHLRNVKINIRGKGNQIIIGEGTVLKDCSFNLYGNNGKVWIGHCCICGEVEFWLEDDGSRIEIGDGTTFGKTHLAAIEGKGITIGPDCMFSSGIIFQTGDAHSILNKKGERINLSKDIRLGAHVWIGMNVMCEKGAVIADNCIVGAGSIVTHQFCEKDCVIAGVPARVLKRDIQWERERI